MADASHRLDLVDRGIEHVHRWEPRCRCGWPGVARRRKKDAVEEYRQHLRSVQRRRRSVPRPVTPSDQLPEALK